jgi:hypothetical protein
LPNIQNKNNQEGWLQLMERYELAEHPNNRFYVRFQVPEGTERYWEARFNTYEFVDWVQLNYIWHGRW